MLYMRLPGGKAKAFTLSYDDGVPEDRRLIEIMNKYGIKGSFHLNSGRYGMYNRMTLEEAKEVYTNCGHEIAIHCVNHPTLVRLNGAEQFHEIYDDRVAMEKDYGVMVRGMSYPNGPYNNDTLLAAKLSGICYSRTTQSCGKYEFPQDWLQLRPTCHHSNPKLQEHKENFAAKEIGPKDHAQMFYVWGHSYEFPRDNNWELIEDLCAYMGGREDIWYATSIELYDYAMAFQGLQKSLDEKIIHNPSAIDVWFVAEGETYCVKSGETLYL